MNEDVLFEHIASQLHTHIRCFDSALNQVGLYTTRKDLNDFFMGKEEYARLLSGPIEEPQMMVINNLLTYIAVPIENCLCLIGPTSVCADCREHITFPALSVPDEIIQNANKVDSSRIIRNGVFLYNLYASKRIEELDCFNRNCSGTFSADTSMRTVTKLLYDHEEYGKRHNPYDAEMREMSAIEHGDLQQLRESWKESFNGNLGILSEDHLRNAKYLSIINIALSSRAAIRGGLPYELAHCLSDTYCQQIDALQEKDLMQLENVIRNIQLTYTEMVAQQKNNPSSEVAEPVLVMRAKDYVFSHLHGKLTVADVAKALAVHPNYLNRIFKQAETITVHDHILQEKVKLARNMLAYSDHSYSDIASFLGFASQSHLGNIFKKKTGMTLKEYRDTYRKGSK